MSKGYNVTNVVNYDERKLQKLYIARMKDCPDEIALGSSKMMEVDRNMIGSPTFINSTVSGATLEDLMAIYSLYEQKGCKIKKILMSVDPWLLNDNSREDRWKSLATDYNNFVNKMRGEGNHGAKEKISLNFEKISEIFSLSYFKTSVAYIVSSVNTKYNPTTSTINDGFTRRVDGSVSFDKAYRNTTTAQVSGDITLEMAGESIYALGNFTEMSADRKLYFEKFISYLRSQNIEISFFLCPYHPRIYEFMKQKPYYSVVFQEEAYFRAIADAYHIKVIGSYNPDRYNIIDSNFFDAYHLRQSAISRIFVKDGGIVSDENANR